MATSRPPWMAPADEAILEDLREERLDYPALIASRRGLNLRHAEERCRVLLDRGLIERVSRETVYRLTTAGERHLDGRTVEAGIDDR